MQMKTSKEIYQNIYEAYCWEMGLEYPSGGLLGVFFFFSCFLHEECIVRLIYVVARNSHESKGLRTKMMCPLSCYLCREGAQQVSASRRYLLYDSSDRKAGS